MKLKDQWLYMILAVGAVAASIATLAFLWAIIVSLVAVTSPAA